MRARLSPVPALQRPGPLPGPLAAPLAGPLAEPCTRRIVLGGVTILAGLASMFTSISPAPPSTRHDTLQHPRPALRIAQQFPFAISAITIDPNVDPNADPTIDANIDPNDNPYEDANELLAQFAAQWRVAPPPAYAFLLPASLAPASLAPGFTNAAATPFSI